MKLVAIGAAATLAAAVLLLPGCGKGQPDSEKQGQTGSAKPEPERQKGDQAVSFPWDRRSILVFYALDSEDADPRSGTPSLVMKDFLRQDKKNSIFVADGVPYLTMLTVPDLRETIKRRKAAGDLSAELVSQLDQILTWMDKSGKKWVGYQTEPEEMAGDGTAHAKARAAEADSE